MLIHGYEFYWHFPEESAWKGALVCKTGLWQHMHVNRVWGNIKNIRLTLKHWETHGCMVSTVATDALVLKHQANSILNAD